jgi:hypothetical protein
MKVACLIVCLLVASTTAGSADGPAGPSPAPAERSRSATPSYFAWAGVGTDPIVIEAQKIEQVGDVVTASGSVRFTNGPRVVLADSVLLDTVKQEAVFTEVRATTCQRISHHYEIRLGRLTLTGKGQVRGMRVSLYLYNQKVFYLPSIKFRLGVTGSGAQTFPTPGFDRTDGFTLSKDLDLVDNDRFQTTAEIRLTSRAGIQGAANAQYGLDSNLGIVPGRVLSYDSMFSDLLEVPRTVAQNLCKPPNQCPVGFARLLAFGTVSLRQHTYDVQDAGLVVYRRPEVGVKYAAKQLSLSRRELDPRLEILPEVRVSYGRIWEQDGLVGPTTRSSFGFGGGLDTVDLGPQTSIQPVFYANWSGYSGGDSLHIGSYGIDASHLWGSNSFVSVRYMKRNARGATPFEFDDVDIFRELQASLHFETGSHSFGYLLGYDADRRAFHDWEALYGYSTDCMTTQFTWNWRMRRLGFNIRLLGL